MIKSIALSAIRSIASFTVLAAKTTAIFVVIVFVYMLLTIFLMTIVLGALEFYEYIHTYVNISLGLYALILLMFISWIAIYITLLEE